MSTLIQEAVLEEKQPDLDFFLHNNAEQKKKEKQKKRCMKPYNLTRIKRRNYLSNISYTGVTEKKILNIIFVFEINVLLTKFVNPFSIERKVHEKGYQEIIYMLWDECIPTKLCKCGCQSENFIYSSWKIAFMQIIFMSKKLTLKMRKNLKRNFISLKIILMEFEK